MIEFKDYNDIPKDFTGDCKITWDNSIRYYKNGEVHKEDGPAIILKNGTKYWVINSKIHNEISHAYEDSKCKSWWYNNIRYGYDEEFTNETWIEFVENKKREEDLKIFL